MATNDSTCWTIIEAAADGRSPERDAFTNRYEPVVRAYLSARWRSSPLRQEIEDACQDFFVECLREGGALNRAQRGRDGGFRAFLYGVVRNIALRWEKRSAQQKVRAAAQEVEFQQIEADETSLSRVFDRAMAKALLQQAAEKQIENAERNGPEAKRRVDLLRLRFHEGRPIREIAELWDANAEHLHREYAKARKEFNQAMTEVVAFHHPQATDAEIHEHCVALLELLG